MINQMSESYRIQNTVGNQTATIEVVIDVDDTVTIRTEKNNPQFVFTRSEPDLVAAMGKCLQEAAEQVKNRKITAA